MCLYETLDNLYKYMYRTPLTPKIYFYASLLFPLLSISISYQILFRSVINTFISIRCMIIIRDRSLFTIMHCSFIAYAIHMILSVKDLHPYAIYIFYDSLLIYILRTKTF